MKSGGQTKSPLGLCPLVVRESRNERSANLHFIKKIPVRKFERGFFGKGKIYRLGSEGSFSALSTLPGYSSTVLS